MDAQEAPIEVTQRTYEFATEFTRFPGGRYRKDGKHSGQEFYEDVLTPLLERREHVVLDLTGVMGFATSFLDGAFGEFAAQRGGARFYRHFTIRCDDDPTLATEILACVQRADATYQPAE